MSRNRARKRRDRIQRNADQQDVRLPTRRPTSSYIKRLMSAYHREQVAPLRVQLRIADASVAALCRLLKERGELPDDFPLRISAELDRLNKPEIPETADDDPATD